MKKLLFMMFLMMGTFSFANSGSAIDPVKIAKVDTTLGCCTVGNIRVCNGRYCTKKVCKVKKL